MTTPILDLIARLKDVDECDAIEAKRSSTELGRSAAETISAFANEPGLGGGYLVFGLHEDAATRQFHVVGVKDPKKIEQDVSSICATGFNHVIRPKIWTERVNGKAVVAAHIPEGQASEKPIFISSRGIANGSFRRIGSTDQRCTEDDLRTLLQLADSKPYEDTVLSDATLDDLDQDVIASYRQNLLRENPDTELRDASVDDLVQSVGGAKRSDGQLVPTVAGLLLFGKRLALRRLYPALRVDYIRVPGTEWMQDAEHRYDSVEVREPLLTAFRRIYAAVLDDLPKSFMLEPGNPERQERLPLPATAVREVLVNALTHRDYRVPATIQVIRFRDRIEVRNPGYSLLPEESFGEPGSQPRNPRLADVFREMRLAENKGTGIGAVRRTMDSAGLTPPVFESDRRQNRFVATLWLHNLIDDDDAAWLRAIAPDGLSDGHAQAMVVARRTGSVRNAMLREMSRLDTLGASQILGQLRDRGLLESKGSGVATHYVLGPAAKGAAAEPMTNRGELGEGPSPNRGEFGTDRGELEADRGNSLPIPEDLLRDLDSLGRKPPKARLREVLVRLTELRPFKPNELATLIKFSDVGKLTERHLAPMVAEGLLVRTHPENPTHPEQAYRARQSSLPVEPKTDPNDAG
jgi:ATP-dependent DNA helicase RecG